MFYFTITLKRCFKSNWKVCEWFINRLFNYFCFRRTHQLFSFMVVISSYWWKREPRYFTCNFAQYLYMYINFKSDFLLPVKGCWIWVYAHKLRTVGREGSLSSYNCCDTDIRLFSVSGDFFLQAPMIYSNTMLPYLDNLDWYLAFFTACFLYSA